MVAAPINLINLDQRGIAYIAGSKMKVAQIVLEQTRLGYTVEEILEAHPHLTLAQIYAALSYYHSHREEVDAFLEAEEAYYEEFCRRNPQQVSREDLEVRRSSLLLDSQVNSTLRIAEEGAEYG